jgi:predicted transcriptional regulator
MADTFKELYGSIVTDITAGQTPDYSMKYGDLASDKKTLLLKKLREHGVPQKVIAKCCGISSSAISQRLKSTKEASLTINIHRLEELNKAGFSSQAIAALFNESGVSMSASDIEAFLKVKQTLSNLSLEIKHD